MNQDEYNKLNKILVKLVYYAIALRDNKLPQHLVNTNDIAATIIVLTKQAADVLPDNLNAMKRLDDEVAEELR